MSKRKGGQRGAIPGRFDGEYKVGGRARRGLVELVRWNGKDKRWDFVTDVTRRQAETIIGKQAGRT